MVTSHVTHITRSDWLIASHVTQITRSDWLITPRLQDVSMIVLDEYDRLLGPDFRSQTEHIVKTVGKRHKVGMCPVSYER